jgi:uncharacterized membrane protein YkvI
MPAIQSSLFRRWFLPGLAFKAAVIGGGYATGREFATFFMPSGPWGGLYGILVAMVIWSVVCAATFAFAHRTRTHDYRSFFRQLLGRLWPVFEIAYFLALVLILAVYAAAAAAIGSALFGWPDLLGSLLFMIAVGSVAAWGNESVEGLFKYVSFLLYGTYIAFIVLSLSRFGGQIGEVFATSPVGDGWLIGGTTYAGYNIIGAIVILSVTRHFTSARDAVVAGLLSGPLAMVPALLFFVSMLAFYPSIGDQPLPSDFLLEQLDLPIFRVIFQCMIFAALWESGTGGVHSINERIAAAYRNSKNRELSKAMRVALTIGLLSLSVFVAGQFGLVALIAEGYRWLAYTFLLIYVLPLMIVTVRWVMRRESFDGGNPVREPANPAPLDANGSN